MNHHDFVWCSHSSAVTPSGSHDDSYWEFQGRQALRIRDWKAYRRPPDGSLALFDLAADVGETTDVAAAHPDVAARAVALMDLARTESDVFPLARS